ncbi:hypothetical protein F511_16071 [Dorcoceras hygrometricum]|uniref:Uncharacterized protein n=1 Tax=Dorcoceras hygrometricum TaxID=472368 RepID=A0A2Z7ABE2_9LAMI|nr:hypothetical protein F511_16071 [Dorcoceras hygrometricum]
MRSVVASHGPGSNPRGPNQTLEEFSRHDIAGASSERRPPPRKISRRQRTTPRQARRTAARKRRTPIARPERIVTQPDPSKRQPAAPLRPAMARSIVWSGATMGGAICAASRRLSSEERARAACQHATTSGGDVQNPAASHSAIFRPPCSYRTASARRESVHRAASARWCRALARPARDVKVSIARPARDGVARAIARARRGGRRRAWRWPGGLLPKAFRSLPLLATRTWLRPVSRGNRHFTYGPFNPYIPIKSTIIGKSRVAIDPIAMHTSWRSNSDIASVTSIGYPRMSASGESSTTMHRILHASGSHPIPTPYDPKRVGKRVKGIPEPGYPASSHH